MFEDLKKTLDKGLDYAFMNAEKVAQAAKDLAKENKLTKEEAKKLYDYLLEKSEGARKSVESEVQQLVKAAIKKMDLVTLEEVSKLEARIARLEGVKKAPAKAKKAPAKKSPAKKTNVKPAV
jgi:polyhydroxyalkanoate synthesis regulator phasin